MVKNSTSKIVEAGKLAAYLEEDGGLRHITYYGHELLNRIYFAVRDANWATIGNDIRGLKVKSSENSFAINFDCHCKNEVIDFRWQCSIHASVNRLIFDIKGRAYSDFQKNRIGFCVLHPISVSGLAATILHSDGTKSYGKFPEYVSPHQPFEDIIGIDWEMNDIVTNLSFHGAIFEMEDQRNWTDASFKTYCTPLKFPFPVKMKKGDEVQQTIILTIKAPKNTVPLNPSSKDFRLSTTTEILPIPKIGLEANEEVLVEPSIRLLKDLNLSHLRVEARLQHTDWASRFTKKLEQAKQLQLPIELIIFFESQNLSHLKQIKKLVENDISVLSVLPIDNNNKSTTESFLKEIFPPIKKTFPNVPVGGGTDNYFTELNRSRPPFEILDFTSFSINPQVHAFDDASILETLQSYPAVIKSLQHISDNQPIHISPITLKPRSNPDATNALSIEKQQVDYRHGEVFNALWTLGVIGTMAKCKSSLLTFFQTLGENGVLVQNSKNDYVRFPVYDIFKIIGGFSDGHIIKTKSSHPLLFEGVLLLKDNHGIYLIANFSEQAVPISVQECIYTLEPKSITNIPLKLDTNG